MDDLQEEMQDVIDGLSFKFGFERADPFILLAR